MELFWIYVLFSCNFFNFSGKTIVISKNIGQWSYPADIYLFKVNNRYTKTVREICSKLIIKTPVRHLLHSFLTLNKFYILFWCLYCWFWASNSTWVLKLFYNTQYAIFQASLAFTTYFRGEGTITTPHHL